MPDKDNLYTTVEVDGKKYSIRKFDARTGLKLARLVLAKLAPMIPMLTEETKGDTDDQQIFKSVGLVLDALNDEDLDMLIDKCLRVCSLILPAGPQPLIDGTGHYGVAGVEYDMGLTIRLIYESIKWGASDFFGGKGLDLSRLTKQTGSSQNQ